MKPVDAGAVVAKAMDLRVTMAELREVLPLLRPFEGACSSSAPLDYPCQETLSLPLATYANSASTRERSRLGKFGLEGNSELRWTPPVRGRVLPRGAVGRKALKTPA